MSNKNNKEHEISEKENQLIDQLKERVKNELPNSFSSLSEEDQDLYLVRWLRARDLNLENAENMLRNSLQWRKEKNADDGVNIVPHSFFPQNFRYSFAGADKQGHPVLLLPIAEWDFRKLNTNIANCKDFGESEFVNFLIHLFEQICHQILEQHLKRQEGQPPVTQFLILVDVKNFPYSQLLSVGAMKRVLQLASTFEAHYPEILFKGVAINSPSYFSMLLTLMKTVLAPKTFGKLVCYSQMAVWQKDMIEIVDPGIIPERYGGTLVAEMNVSKN